MDEIPEELFWYTAQQFYELHGKCKKRLMAMVLGLVDHDDPRKLLLGNERLPYNAFHKPSKFNPTIPMLAEEYGRRWKLQPPKTGKQKKMEHKTKKEVQSWLQSNPTIHTS